MITIDGQRIPASGVVILAEGTTKVTFPAGSGIIGLMTKGGDATGGDHFSASNSWTGFHLDPEISTHGLSAISPIGDQHGYEVEWIADPTRIGDRLFYRLFYTVRELRNVD